MAQLWGMMNNLASLTVLSMISVNIPGPARFISKSLIQFAQFDIFPTDYFINNMLKLKFSNDDQDPITPQLEDLGFGDISTTLNLGSSLVFCLAYVSLHVLLLVLSRLKSKGRFFLNQHEKLHHSLIWGQGIRLIAQQYLTFYLSSLIFMEDVTFSSLSGDNLDLIACVLFFTVCTLFPIGSLFHLLRNAKHMDDEAFKTKYGVFIELVSTQTFSKACFNLIELIKLQSTILILFYLREHPSIQITVLYFQSVLFQAYLVQVKPFADKLQNQVQVMNEFLVTLYLLPMILLTDYVFDYDIKYYSGIMLIGVYMISFVANICFFISKSIKQYILNRQRKLLKAAVNEQHKKYKQDYQKEGNQTLNIENPTQKEKKTIRRSRSKGKAVVSRVKKFQNAPAMEHERLTVPKVINQHSITGLFSAYMESRQEDKAHLETLTQIDNTFFPLKEPAVNQADPIAHQNQQVRNLFAKRGLVARQRSLAKMINTQQWIAEDDEDIDFFAVNTKIKEKSSK